MMMQDWNNYRDAVMARVGDLGKESPELCAVS